jgi:hypothetical protein
VLIALAPRLLSDLVARAIDRPDIDVVIDSRGGPAHVEERFLVAVVSEGAPDDITADTIIRLPSGEGNVGMGSLVTAEGEEAIVIDDLDALAAIIGRLSATAPA